MTENVSENPFAELPAALVDEILQRTTDLSTELLHDFEHVRANRQKWRRQLVDGELLRRDSDLAYVPIPTTCGVDGSYAVERLLATDLVAAAAVAVEGLTPPSETRHWPEPRHQLYIETEAHENETGTILRALMIGMESVLALNAPHDVVFLDGSLTTPLIFFNQALNKTKEAPNLQVTKHLHAHIIEYLTAYRSILSSSRSDRCWLAMPKYTTRREIGRELLWPDTYDDRGLLSLLLEPGEFTCPQTLEQPPSRWHLNVEPLSTELRKVAESINHQIIAYLQEIQVLYYRPYPWLPALRLEMGRAVTENPARLAIVLHGIRHQCGAPAVLEPYPLYMADRMVKHLPKAIPTFRQVTSQRIAEAYTGNLEEVLLGLHGYRTESGV